MSIISDKLKSFISLGRWRTCLWCGYLCKHTSCK